MGEIFIKILMDNFWGGNFNMVYAKLTLKVNLHLVTVQQLNNFLKFYIDWFKMVSTLMNNGMAMMKDLKKAPNKKDEN
jgi:hypothetical protein